MFNKILIANRGEIALRVVRACRDLGIRSVVAYSEADRDSLPVRLADEAVCIGPAPPERSYLHIPAVMSAALMTGADALHPGYGFLSENPYIAEICEKLGITFIGPSPKVIEQMGDKAAARRAMKSAGMPVLPGSEEPLLNAGQARELAEVLGYPLILKAVGGGGGRGMRVVRSGAEVADAFAIAGAEAGAAFRNPDLYFERYLHNPRHVEVQVLGDNHGHLIHLGTRDCSLQRRHQKVLEEGPAPGLDPALLDEIAKSAIKGCRAIGYTSAGTFEFLVEPVTNAFYFIEMNTRIQVEHPVTEMITGVDLVKWQIRLAAGERLTLQQKAIRITGHAIECRINAEDPRKGFMPQAGMIALYLPPGGIGVRVDSHLYSGYTAPASYDSLLGKLIVWGEDRAEAVARMRRALAEYIVVGPTTTIPFQQAILRHPAFERGEVHVGFLGQWMDDLIGAAPAVPAPAAAPPAPAAGAAPLAEPEAKEQAADGHGQAETGHRADRPERAGDDRQPDNAGDAGGRQNGRRQQSAPRRRRTANPQPGAAGS
jgi:acetyl-CoA carboxylase biotin carboxylase subunit